MNSKPTLAVIFVVYREYEAFNEFLRSTLPLAQDVRIVIVDNTESENRVEHFRTKWAEIYGLTLISPGNVGYLGAARVALARVPEIGECLYVALANTDLDWNIHDTVVTLRNRGREGQDAGVGAIAPMLCTRHGIPDVQLHYWERPSALKYQRLSSLYSIYPLGALHRFLGDSKRSLKRRLLSGRSAPADCRIFAPHGALILFTADYVSRDEAFHFEPFLFCEEVQVGLTCEKEGLRCIFVSEFRYGHNNHGSMGRFPSRRIVGYLRESHAWAGLQLTL